MADVDLLADAGLGSTTGVPGVDLLADTPAAPPQAARGPFARGISTGMAGLRSAGAGILAAGADAVGAPGVEQTALDYAKRQQDQAAPDAMRVEDVDTLSKGFDFVKYALGTAAPSLLLTAIGGVAGRAVGSLGARALEDAARVAAARTGTLAGMATASVGQEVGSIFPDAKEQGVENPVLRSVIGGTAAAALDVLPEALIARRLGLLGGEVAKPVMQGLGARLAGAAGEALKIGGIEAGTEGAQTVIERLSAGQGITTPEGISDIINSAAVGGLSGGVLGGATGGINGPQPVPTTITADPVEPGAPPQPPVSVAAPAGAPEGLPPLATDFATPPAAGEFTVPPNPNPPLAPFDATRSVSDQQLFQSLPTDQPVADNLADLRTQLDTSLADGRTPKAPAAQDEVAARQTRIANATKFADNFDKLEADDLGRFSRESDTAWQVDNATGRREFAAAPNQMQSAMSDAIKRANEPQAEPKAAPTPAPAVKVEPAPPTTGDLMSLIRLNRNEPVLPAAAQALTQRGLTEPRANGSYRLTQSGYRTMQSMRRAAIEGRNPMTVTQERRSDIVHNLAIEGIRDNLNELSASMPPGQQTKLGTVAPELLRAAQQASRLPTLQAASQEMRSSVNRIMRGVVTNKQGALDTFADDLSERIFKAPTFYNKGALQTETPQFQQFFKGSHVVDAQGQPLVVYRGEHGVGAGQVQSREGSIAFGSKAAASTYAESPNRHGEIAAAPRVTPAYLSIKRPFLNDAEDPFVDVARIARALGPTEAKRVAIKFASDIENTNAWQENFADKYTSVKDLVKQAPERINDLYFDAFKYLADPKEVALLKQKGFDGAIHGGNGETALEPEYKVFDTSQIKSALGNRGTFDPNDPDILRNQGAISQAETLYGDLFRDETLQQVGTTINATLHSMVGNDPALTIQNYYAEPGQHAGRYMRTAPLKGMIEVAFNAKNPVSVAYHEGYHYLEDRALSGEDRAIVKAGMRPGTRLYKAVIDRVRLYDSQNRTSITDEVRTNPAEARAYAFEFWQRGELVVPTGMAKVFQKLAQFLESVRNLINGYGFRTTEDVFEAIEKGAYRYDGVSPRPDPAANDWASNPASPLYSGAATISPDLQQQARAATRAFYERGELSSQQGYDMALALTRHANIAPIKATQVFGAAAQAMLNGFDRTRMRTVATHNYAASRSVAFKNAVNVLKTLDQRRNYIISDASRVGLSKWHESRPQADYDTVGKAMVERTIKGMQEGDAAYQTLVSGLSQEQQAMMEQANAVTSDLLQRTFVADQNTYADALDSVPLLQWIRQQATPPEDQAVYDASRALGEQYAQTWAEQYVERLGKVPSETEVLKRDAQFDQFARWYIGRRSKVQENIQEGYFPLRRFGQHVVRAFITKTDEKGREQEFTLFRDHFETEGPAIYYAKAYAKVFGDHAPEVKVEKTILARIERDTSISMQEFLDAARRNGIDLSQDEKERVARALIAADSAKNNRIFRREGTPGASTDAMRVLHEFIVNSAAQISRSELNPSLNDAIAGKPVDAFMDRDGTIKAQTDSSQNLWKRDGGNAGFYQNHLNSLVDYVLVPDHSAAGRFSSMWRGAAMNYFLGGSIASGIVNMLSVPMNVPAWLALNTSISNATATTYGAWKEVLSNPKLLNDLNALKDPNRQVPVLDKTPGLRDAFVRGLEDGTLADSEIHQIMGIAGGSVLAKSRKVQNLVNGWMWPFRFGERTNRATTFIAAWRVGLENGKAGRELYDYAKDAVDNTQNSYSAVNRPVAARTPVGGLLFMFKSYPLFIIEMMEAMFRQNPKAAVFMLTSLLAFAGIEGMPFAENALDLIDVISQRLFGSPFNSRRAMRNILKDTSEMLTGMDLTEVALHGVINELTTLNVGSRIGVGDFVPGTRLGAADTDTGKLLENLLPAPLAMARDVLTAAGSLGAGLVGNKGLGDAVVDAAREGAPSAVRNVIKGGEQLVSDYALDARGRKNVAVSAPQAFFQLLGFSSHDLQTAYEKDAIKKQTQAFYQQVQQELSGSLMKAVRDGKPDKVADVYGLMAAWTQANPSMPMVINPASIRKQIQESGMTLGERTQRSLPRALRGQSTDY